MPVSTRFYARRFCRLHAGDLIRRMVNPYVRGRAGPRPGAQLAGTTGSSVRCGRRRGRHYAAPLALGAAAALGLCRVDGAEVPVYLAASLGGRRRSMRRSGSGYPTLVLAGHERLQSWAGGELSVAGIWRSACVAVSMTPSLKVPSAPGDKARHKKQPDPGVSSSESSRLKLTVQYAMAFIRRCALWCIAHRRKKE